MGPTASGKSSLAEALAEWLSAQLINADAFQVYRGLDIGTAKPDRRDGYLGLDLKDPAETFGVGEFVGYVRPILEDLYRQGRSAVIVGGTGLNIRALFEEYDAMGDAPPEELRTALSALPLEELVVQLERLDPVTAARIDLKNRARVQRYLERALAPSPSIATHLPPFLKMKFGLVPPILETEARIAQRTASMIQNGWIEEVQGLRTSGVTFESPGLRAIGYRTLWKYLDGEIELEEAIATTIAETRRYAKRQRTWLRSEPNLVTLDWSESPFGMVHHLLMQKA